MVAFAEQRGLRVMVDQNYRYLPDMLALRHVVQQETAGRPAFVTVTFNCDWPARTYQAGMANTMLLEMAVHHLDSIRFVLGGETTTVSGRTWRPPWTRYAGDTWVAGAFTFPRKVHVLSNAAAWKAPGAGGSWQSAVAH